MFTNNAVFKCLINEKEYFFICQNESPLGDSKEALFYFLKCLGYIEDNIKAQQEAAKNLAQENSKIEPLNPVPEIQAIEE